MSSWVELLAERRAAAAAARGELSGLAGEGRPLDPARLAESTDDTLMRIMAEAGAVPEEFVLKRQIEALRAEVAAAPPEARRAMLAEIARLETRAGLAADMRRRFMRG